MWRLGVVSFLNSRPLIAGLADDPRVTLTFDVPAALAGRLERGEVDAALVPIIDVLRNADGWRIISDACIGCDGETMTVRVFSQVPPDRIETLWADTDSHTSVALATVLWRELFGRDLELRRLDARSPRPDDLPAVLLIGDKVVDPGRGRFAYEVDLGGAWRQHTGLPFVFAVWAVRNSEFTMANSELRIANSELRIANCESRIADGRLPTASSGLRELGAGPDTPLPLRSPQATRCGEEGLGEGNTPIEHPTSSGPRAVGERDSGPGASPNSLLATRCSALAALLNAARDRGVATAAEIAERDGPRLGWPVALARRYLTQCLTFRLDGRHVAGAELFAQRCAALGRVPPGHVLPWPTDLRAATAEPAP